MKKAQDTYDKFVSDLHDKWSSLVTAEEKAMIQKLGTSRYAARAQWDLVDWIGAQREHKQTVELVDVSREVTGHSRPTFHAKVKRYGIVVKYTWQAELQRSGLRVMCWTVDRDLANERLYSKVIDRIVTEEVQQ